MTESKSSMQFHATNVSRFSEEIKETAGEVTERGYLFQRRTRLGLQVPHHWKADCIPAPHITQHKVAQQEQQDQQQQQRYPGQAAHQPLQRGAPGFAAVEDATLEGGVTAATRVYHYINAQWRGNAEIRLAMNSSIDQQSAGSTAFCCRNGP